MITQPRKNPGYFAWVSNPGLSNKDAESCMELCRTHKMSGMTRLPQEEFLITGLRPLNLGTATR